MSKTYKKYHKNPEVAEIHIAKIKKRGGIIDFKNKTIIGAVDMQYHFDDNAPSKKKKKSNKKKK